MQTIEFVPFEWDDADFNPEIDRIGCRGGGGGSWSQFTEAAN